MKKIGKLQINPEKLMKNEELLTLRGGYSCICNCYDWDYVFQGTVANSSALTCNADCLKYIVEHGFGNWACS